MTDTQAFYRALEDKMRGSRKLIRERLEIYRPILKTLVGLSDSPAALDIGCGRGEWLEELLYWGFSPIGVEMDQGMLEVCHKLKLPAELGDGIERLINMPDHSLTLVSAFHVLEHLDFDQVQILVKEALRVLCPGGLLIIETPNPENISVGTHTFYMDPTHEKPIPPALMLFLTEHYGFSRTHLVRLQQGREIEEKTLPTLSNVIFDVSPDYGIVARTKGDPEQENILDALFEMELGKDLQKVAAEYDRGIIRSFNKIDSTLQELTLQVNKYDVQMNKYDVQMKQYDARIQALSTELKSLYNSRSWKITRPLRQLFAFVRSIKN